MLFVKKTKSRIILSIGLFLLPFCFISLGGFTPEWGKAVLTNIWIIVLCGIFLFSKSYSKKPLTRLVLTAILLLVVMIIASLQGEDIYQSIMSNGNRFDGLLTFTFLVAYMFVISIVWQQEWLKPVAKGISYSAVIISVVAIAVVLINISSDIAGFVPFFKNRQILTGYLLTSLPFSFIAFSKRKWLYIGLQSIAILLCHSVAGILGLGLFVIGYFFFIHKNQVKKGLILILLVSVIGITGFLLRENSRSISFESRTRILVKSFYAVKEKPVLGWGWANFDYAFRAIEWPIATANDIYMDKAHSTILEYAVTTGIVGLAIYILLLFQTIRVLLKSSNRDSHILLLVLLLYLFHAQTNIVSISQELLFWTVAGIASNTL